MEHSPKPEPNPHEQPEHVAEPPRNLFHGVRPTPEIPDTLRDQSPSKPAEPRQSTMSSLAEMGRAWGMALDFIVMIFAGAGLGWAFDKWQSTNPNGLMIGLGLGFVIAFIRIVRATQAQERADAARKNRGQP